MESDSIYSHAELYNKDLKNVSAQVLYGCCSKVTVLQIRTLKFIF